MKNTVLIVMDVQTALIKANPHNAAGFIENIQSLIHIHNARHSGIEVIYVQPDAKFMGEGDWGIYHKITPNPIEKVFDKRHCSAFKETDLHRYLQAKGIVSIILVGISTELCVDTTCRVAFEYGYHVIIPESTTTTYDNEFFSGEALVRFYEKKIWNNRFAKVIPVSEIIKQM